MTANQISSSTFSGAPYQTNGPAFNSVPFSPTAVMQTQVGTGQLTFGDVNYATFSYTVNGVSQAKAITRQVFATLPTCVWGAEPNLALATNVSGLWWAAAAGIEAGRGINFSQQGNTIFATWFTYNGDGTPLWLSVTAFKTAVWHEPPDRDASMGARVVQEVAKKTGAETPLRVALLKPFTTWGRSIRALGRIL